MYQKLFYATEDFAIPEIAFSDMDNSHINNIKKENVATLNYCKNRDIYLFAFKTVEPHIDGNGMSSFWLMKGEGEFHFPETGENLYMQEGDIILFDDHRQHGFKGNGLCMGLSLMWDKTPNQAEIENKINDFLESQNYQINLKKRKTLKRKM